VTVLALDPSSTCVGYALLRAADVLVECGRLTPAKARATPAHRIPTIGQELAALLAATTPTEVVIEITSGKVAGHARARGHNGAGLGVYGMAVGYLWRECVAAVGESVATVEENVWTAGVPKNRRARYIATLFPVYRTANDPGGDIADAIGLGRWYLQRLGTPRRTSC
jgi:hypothetical protein